MGAAGAKMLDLHFGGISGLSALKKRKGPLVNQIALIAIALQPLQSQPIQFLLTHIPEDSFFML